MAPPPAASWFGLSATDLEQMRRRRRRAYARLRRHATHLTWAALCALAFAWAGAFAVAVTLPQRVTLLIALAFGPAAATFLDRLGREAAPAGLWFIDPVVARYECFARASRAYSGWLARQVAGWWRNLDERGWQRALRTLFTESGWRVQAPPRALAGEVAFVLVRGEERQLVRSRAAAAQVTIAVLRDFADACAEADGVAGQPLAIARLPVSAEARAYAGRAGVALLELDDILAMQRRLPPPMLAQRSAWRWVPAAPSSDGSLALHNAFAAARRRLAIRRAVHSAEAVPAL